MHSCEIVGLLILCACLFATIKADKVVSRIWVEEGKPKGHPVAEMSTILTHNSGKPKAVKYKLLYGMENSIPSDGKSVSNSFGGKSTPGTPWVDLNEDTGSLTLHRRLDRERDCVDKSAVCSVQFQVVLLPQVIFKIADVTLTLKDINDNPPVFPVRQASLNVSEDAKVGTEINLDRYQATDSDIGNNSAIQYFLSSSKIFSLKQFTDRTGLRHLRLLLRQRLDYSKAKNHKLVLTATDRGKKPLSGNITFMVFVQDANDFSPVFDQKLYHVTLREDKAIGDVIGRVHASDADPGTLGVVTYRITSSSSRNAEDDELIDVNRHSGEVILRKKLDRATYDGTRIIIEACDGSVDDPKTDEAVFVISVDDVNDNAPEISISCIVDAEDDIIYVSELDPINTYLAHISATDADNGNNGEVRIQVHSYSIVKDEDKNTTLELDSNCVFLDAEGLLGTGCLLDRESQDLYRVVIEACDKGSPSKCTKQNITIVVLDENEYAPTFPKSGYRVKMAESSNVGSYVATCIAKDEDSVKSESALFKNKNGKMVKSRNGEITYALSATNGKAVTYLQNDEQIPFEFDVRTGKITLLRPLDYESAKKWRVTVTARDGNDKAPKTSTCNVTVSLDDVNDNRPVFTSPASDNMTITISVREDSRFVINLTVVDFDHEMANEITYDVEAIYSVDHGNRYTKAKKKMFNVNKQSGEIKIRGKAEDNIGKYFLKIRAFDSTENYSSSRAVGLFVVICDCTIEKASAALTVALALGAAAILLLIVVFGIAIALIRRHRIASRAKKVAAEQDNKEEKAGGLVVRTKRDSQSSRSDVFASPRSTTSSRHSDVNKKGPNNNRTRSSSCGGAPPGQCYVCDLSNSSPSLTDHSPYHTLVANMINGKKSEAQIASSPSDHDSGRGSSDTRSDLMEKNTHREKTSDHYYCPYPPTVDENTELSEPCSDYSGKLRSPQHNNGMGPHCSPACIEIGHCDTCWMPSGIGSDKQKEPYRKMRRGSECSTETDTTSSGASYYRMTPNLKMSSSFTTSSSRRRGSSDVLPKSMTTDYANSGHCKHESLGNDGAFRTPPRPVLSPAPHPNVPETHYVTERQNPLPTRPRTRASWARGVNPAAGYMSITSNVNCGTTHEVGRIGRTSVLQRSPEKTRRTTSLTRTAIV